MVTYKTFPTDITSKSNPVDADILLIADSEDNNEMKQITIGSITADIADGIINDSAYNTTQTYSSSKINALDTAISNIATTDASTSTKGRTKLSVAPASAANPIAVGDNDTRVPPINTSTMTANQVAAMVGTGTPNGTTGKYVTNDDTGTSGNSKVLRLASDGKLPALDGSNLTNLADSANLQFGLSTQLAQNWFTMTLPIASTGAAVVPTGWLGTVGGASDEYNALYGKIQPSAGAGTYGILYTKLPGTTTLSNYQYSASKDIRVKFYIKCGNDAQRKVFGLTATTTPANAAEDQTGTTDGNIRFIIAGTSSYAHNSNGTATATTLSGVTITQWNEYEIIYNPGTDIKFYVNGTLVATHTTNLPTTASQIYLFFAQSDSNSIESAPVHISIEK